MPRILMSQAGGETIAKWLVADATIEGDGFDQAESKDYRKLAEFL
jgi:hypothetical protein